jgi:hypothetical protein
MRLERNARMPDRYPDNFTYETQYAKYLQTPADTLLKLADFRAGECFLDLCSGNCRQSLEALADGCVGGLGGGRPAEMIPKSVLGTPKLNIKIATIETYLKRHIDGGQTPNGAALFHVIGCQQAVNNWLTRRPRRRSRITCTPAPGRPGRFVFNTFNTKPPEKPLAREYWLPNPHRKFVEVVHLVGNTVHHVQCAEGCSPHHTTFRWITREEYHDWLSPTFDVEVTTKDKTDYYLCRKK